MVQFVQFDFDLHLYKVQFDFLVHYTEHQFYDDEIEKSLLEYGEPLRWAVVNANKEKFLVEAVFVEN